MGLKRLVSSTGIRAFIALCIGLVGACTTSDEKPDTQALVARGDYLVSIAGCDDCHSPKVFDSGVPETDASRRLSGHPAGSALPPLPANVLGPERWAFVGNAHMTAWAGPWGISFATNLTPHKDGLGFWTEDQFVQTLRKGTHLGVGRPVLPPMPWPAYRNMSDEDLRAIYAFLKTIPPVANLVPQPISPELAQSSVR